MKILANCLQILCLLLPFLLILINRKIFRQKFGIITLYIVSCVLSWVLVQISVQLIDLDLQKQLDIFDLNHDGIFSPDEITPQQEQAFNKAFNAVVSDTGRALAPITGAIVSVVYNGFIFGVVMGFYQFFRPKNP